MKYRFTDTPQLDMKIYKLIQQKVNMLHSNNKVIGESGEDGEVESDKFADYLRHLNITPTSCVDVGCRLGHGAVRFKHHFPQCRVAAVDIVDAFYSYLLEFPSIEPYIVDMHHMDKFKDGEFDVSMCVGSLEHAYDIEKALREILRITRDISYIVVPLEDDYGNISHNYCTTDITDWTSLVARCNGKLDSINYRGDNVCLIIGK